jgi:hypothetical protein
MTTWSNGPLPEYAKSAKSNDFLFIYAKSAIQPYPEDFFFNFMSHS